MEKKILVSILAFAFIISMISFSSATPITNCTDINSAGVYDLQNDINVSELFNTICININSNDVIFNGNGHTLWDSREQLNTLIQDFSANVSNITIENLNGNNSQYGILFYSVGDNLTNFVMRNINLNNMPLMYDTNAESYLVNALIENVTVTGIQYSDFGFQLNFVDNLTLNNINLMGNDAGISGLYITGRNVNADNINIAGFTLDCLEISGDGTNTFNNFNCIKNSTESNPNLIIGDASNGEFIFNDLSLTDFNGQAFIPTITFNSENNLPLNYSIIPLYPIVQISESNPRLIHGSGDIFNVMDSVGSGFGIFISLMGATLPVLLIGLGIVGVIVGIGLGIYHIIIVSINRGK